MPANVVVASNRGPVSFGLGDGGELRGQRGGGGLVSGVAGAAPGPETLWICAALGQGDRLAARAAPSGRLDLGGHDTGGLAVQMLDIDEATFHRAYNAVANSTLWFVNHMLYDTPRRPNFDSRFARDWQAYVEYNTAFAEAIAQSAAPRARVLVQDYHLTLAPKLLRARRPDLAIGHFSHTPWAPPDYFRLLPDTVSAEVVAGVLGSDYAGFLANRWAAGFLDCAEQVCGAKVRRSDDGIHVVEHSAGVTRVGVNSLGVDAEGLRKRAGEPDVAARESSLRERAGGRRVILRIDRTELSKNIVRGLAAYRELLHSRPEWRGRVTHFVFAYPSRHDLPEYREYTASVQRLVQAIEDEFGSPEWAPVHLEVSDDFARSLAAYRIADVLVVNPIRDGMNLVAKEGPVLSAAGVALVLSREAGAAEELGEDALCINPYDVSATAEAMDRALRLPAEERADRCRRLAAAAAALPPQRWLADQLAALSSA